MPGEVGPDEQARIDSVLGGARNPNNWLVRAKRLYRSALELLKAKQGADRRLWTSPLFVRSWSHSPTDEEIRDHSDAFEESMGYGMTSVLLRALAIENLLKGLLVHRDPEKWIPRPAAAHRPLYHWTHDLEVLASDADIELDPESARVCRQLTLYIEWGGRYPTAMAPKKHGPEGATWRSADDPLVTALYERLLDQLKQRIGIRDL